jgi:Flp pilus assembly protein TadG
MDFNASLTVSRLQRSPSAQKGSPKMIGFIRKLLKDRRGNVLAIACAAMPMIVGCAGLATDTIEWTLWKRQLQRAADSAALAGVYDRAQATGGSTDNTPTAVCNDLAVNLHTSMPLVGSSPCTGSVGSYSVISYPGDTTYVTKQVQITLRVQRRLPFSSLFMSAAPVIQAVATAGAVSYGGSPCMLALNGSGTAINNSGNTTITAPNCIFYSNSASSNSAAAGGSSSVTAKAIAGVGGVASSNNWHVTSYMPYSPTLPDPFGPSGSNPITPDSSDMHCAQAAVTTTTTTTVVDTPAWDETVTDKKGRTSIVHHAAITHNVTTTSTGYTGAAQSLSDGVDITTLKDSNGNQANCFTSLDVGSNRTLAIPNSYTGPIYINGGSVDLKGAFSCSACTIVLTNKDTSNTATIGTFSSNAQATNNITAPTTGVYKGIAIYQDRRATGNTDKINGGSSNVISGVVYFPSDTLQLNGTGSAVSLCSMFVAKNLVFNGNGTIAISAPSDSVCASVGMPNSSTISIIRLIA